MKEMKKTEMNTTNPNRKMCDSAQSPSAPYYLTAGALARRGRGNLPEEMITGKHLLYSSPATLAFHSPGAQGFGVKRAGLAVPGSVMLLAAPGCCGRNTGVLSEDGPYGDRFFYLMLDETDIVTGRHVKKIPQAVEEIIDALKEKPTVVMLCITCVDALLGTDMERICRKAEERTGVPVRPCYMYALTREGRKPPMVHVRQSIYSLLAPRKKKSTSVNLLGHFSPLFDDCELYDLLRQMGVKTIREISRCRDYEEYLAMAEANFNVILHPEARFAAEDIRKWLAIPSVELTRLYQIDKIKNQYALFAAAIGASVDDTKYYEETKAAIEAFKRTCPPLCFAVGEGCNANPFELSLALLQYGFAVSEIFANIGDEDFIYLEKIAALSPGTRVYSNLEPTMLYYDCAGSEANITVGVDAAYYHENAAHVEWNDEEQPFGYAGVRHFFAACKKALRADSSL